MSESQQETTCWWHPDRRTGLRCTRCERYACPECLHEASVGYQCADCINEGARQAKQQAAAHRRAGFGYRTVAGARASSSTLVTWVLIALNVLAYVVTAVQSRDPLNNYLGSPVFNAGFLRSTAVAFLDEWWRLIASGFLHFGLLHLAVNMLALWFIGRDLERLLGATRYLAVYGLSLLGGSAAVFVFDDLNKDTAGASGAVYGILGGVLVGVLRLKLNAAPVVGIIALNLFISIQVPEISLLGHLGGLVVGALVTAALVYAPERHRVLLQSTAVVVVLVALVVLIVFRDASLTEYCVTRPEACFSG